MHSRDAELANTMSKPREINANEDDDEDINQFPKNVLLCFKDVCMLIEEEIIWLENNKLKISELNQLT